MEAVCYFVQYMQKTDNPVTLKEIVDKMATLKGRTSVYQKTLPRKERGGPQTRR
jgi:hypothetical protein